MNMRTIYEHEDNLKSNSRGALDKHRSNYLNKLIKTHTIWKLKYDPTNIHSPASTQCIATKTKISMKILLLSKIERIRYHTILIAMYI